MYKRTQRGWLKHIDFILLDLLCLVASYFTAHLIRHKTVWLIFNNQLYTNMLLTLTVFDLLIILMTETMHNVVRRGYFVEFRATAKQAVLVLAMATIFLFTLKDGAKVSRTILWLTIILHALSSYIVRVLWKKHLVRRHTRQLRLSMILVADSTNVEQILARIRKSTFEDINVTGIVLADRDATGETIGDIPVVCSLEDAPRYICREWIDEVYISTATPPMQLMEKCAEMGVTTHREIYNIGGERQFVEKIAGAYVVTNALNSATPSQVFFKRMMDIVGGLVGSVMALIIMAVVGPRIKQASPGPILFKQERVGQNGKHFTMYKIRSMYMDAEARKAELMKNNRVADGMMFKLDFDPRIIGNEILPDGTHKTGIGEFIRNTSLDEFPQFFNVLMGQMSLVGTRPPTLDEWEKYEYHHRTRLAIKPGVTGMWQVNGRSKVTDFEEVVKLDTEYINNWDIGLDFRILLKTIVSVIKRDGAM